MSARKGPRKSRPATTPEGRENQLTSLAYDLAEKQLRDGSASAQVITVFLKAGSQRERLEQSRLERENLLLAAKVDQMASAKRVEELYERAMSAFRDYSGESSGDPYDDGYGETDDDRY